MARTDTSVEQATPQTCPLSGRQVKPKDALDLLALGFSLLPIEAGTKRPPKNYRWKRYQEQPPLAATVRRWYSNGANRGLGVVTGRGRRTGSGIYRRQISASDSAREDAPRRRSSFLADAAGVYHPEQM